MPAVSSAAFAAAVFSFFVSFDDLILALFVMSRQYTLPVGIWQDRCFEIDRTLATAASHLTAHLGLHPLGDILQMHSKKRLGLDTPAT